jgi:AraC family transcriptional regulator
VINGVSLITPERAMRIDRDSLRAGRPCHLAADSPALLLRCLAGRDAGAAAVVSPPLLGLWINLDARLRVVLAEGSLLLRPRHCLLSQAEQPVHAVAEAAGAWVLLAFPGELAARALAPDGGCDPSPRLFPAQLPLTRDLLRCLRSLRPAATAGLPGCYEASLLRETLLAIERWQRPLLALLPRCPGKTLAARRHCLHRLLRARSRVELEGHERTSVAQMAMLAHYSPCYFVRVFEEVFGESPQAFCSRLRMQRAASLLRESRLSITEIADCVGYASGAAFARAFRARHGISASVARRLWGSDAAAA